MQDYSDLIYLLGAMIIFSLLSIHVNRTFMFNNLITVSGQTEYYALNLGQEYVDRIRWLPTPQSLESFVNGFPQTIEYATKSNGPGIPFEVNISLSDTTLPDANVQSKIVSITLNSIYMESIQQSIGMNRNIEMKYIKSFHQ